MRNATRSARKSQPVSAASWNSMAAETLWRRRLNTFAVESTRLQVSAREAQCASVHCAPVEQATCQRIPIRVENYRGILRHRKHQPAVRQWFRQAVHYKFASFSYAKACCFTHAGVSGENSPDRLSGESPRQSAI